MEAYVNSDMGHQQWIIHKEGGVPIAENQSEMIELQRKYILYCQKEYGQDKSDLPNV